MRVDSWSGLVTNASPFALPPSAAVEQVNLQCHIPGQIQSRGGMRPVVFTRQAPELTDTEAFSAGTVLDCCPCFMLGQPMMIVLRPDGAVGVLGGGQYGAPLATPAEPELEPPPGSEEELQEGYGGTYRVFAYTLDHKEVGE